MGNPERTKFDSEPDGNPIRIYSPIEPVIKGLVKVANNIGKTTKFRDIYAVEIVPDQPIIGAPVIYGLNLYGEEKHKARIGRAFHFIKPGLEKLYDTYHKDSIQNFYEKLAKVTFTFWRIIDRSERMKERRKKQEKEG